MFDIQGLGEITFICFCSGTRSDFTFYTWFYIWDQACYSSMISGSSGRDGESWGLAGIAELCLRMD